MRACVRVCLSVLLLLLLVLLLLPLLLCVWVGWWLGEAPLSLIMLWGLRVLHFQILATKNLVWNFVVTVSGRDPIF